MSCPLKMIVLVWRWPWWVSVGSGFSASAFALFFVSYFSVPGGGDSFRCFFSFSGHYYISLKVSFGEFVRFTTVWVGTQFVF